MGPYKSVALVLVTTGMLGFAQQAAAQAIHTVDVTGTVTQGKKLGTLEGTVSVQRFRVDDGVLLADGRLNAVVQFADGKTRQIKNARVSMPVDLEKSGISDSDIGLVAFTSGKSAALECDVLNLVLGPLDLNLLGLEIHLNQVLLDIIADPAGGLLGSLLAILCNLGISTLTDLLALLLGNLNLLAGLLNLIMILG